MNQPSDTMQKDLLALGSFAFNLSSAYGHLGNFHPGDTPAGRHRCRERVDSCRTAADRALRDLMAADSPFAAVCESALAAFDAALDAAAR